VTDRVEGKLDLDFCDLASPRAPESDKPTGVFSIVPASPRRRATAPPRALQAQAPEDVPTEPRLAPAEQLAPLPIHHTVTIADNPPPAADAPAPVRQTTQLIIEPARAQTGTQIIEPAEFALAVLDPGPLTPGGTLIMAEPPSGGARPSHYETTLITAEELLTRRATAELGRRHANPHTGTDAGEEPRTKSLPVEELMRRANRYAAPNGFDASAATAVRRAGKESVFTGIAATWRETSLPRKASLILMPFVMALFAVAYVKPALFPKPARRATPPAVSVARHAAAEQAPSASAAPAPGTQLPLPLANDEAPAAGDVKGKTSQRKAADAIAEGDHARALEHYRRLARAHPEVAAYREAARILEQRAASAP
jgi:hypothetical protein